MNLSVALLTRILALSSQIFIFIFIYKFFGTEQAGYYSLYLGTSSILLMIFTFTITKFIVIRYKRRSYTFFSSVLFVSSIISLIAIMILVMLLDLNAVFFVLIYLLRFFDFYHEVNMIYFRRKKEDLKLFKIQVLKFISTFLIMIGAYAEFYSFNVMLAFFILVGAGICAYSFVDNKLKLRIMLSHRAFKFYIRMFKDGRANAINGSLSTFFTNSPRYALGFWVSIESVAIYTLLSYFYTTLCNFSSMFLQVYLSRIDDIRKDFFQLIKKMMVCYSLGIFACSIVVYLFVESILYTLLGSVDGNEGLVTAVLVLCCLPLFLRDVIGYYLMSINKLYLINYSVFSTLLFFWVSAILLAEDNDLISVSCIVFFSTFIPVLFTYYFVASKDFVMERT
ncbi:lipopolysaccharide biosynthesis protein [Pseudoalteromonas sp. Angola-4]|uniref:lipopolysaccharide biosynthesis protein n=1 Tax=Pseudoalteromonas sp. Angola-4 TaxID=3025335 RepID=UPI002359D7D9|nr:hypothetical protein [Pseudoalteromonas sp. Angola-4]MDC9511492.1 hypothetical protein [Pseudoalteromonas sp. Angola-4]